MNSGQLVGPITHCVLVVCILTRRRYPVDCRTPCQHVFPIKVTQRFHRRWAVVYLMRRPLSRGTLPMCLLLLLYHRKTLLMEVLQAQGDQSFMH